MFILIKILVVLGYCGAVYGLLSSSHVSSVRQNSLRQFSVTSDEVMTVVMNETYPKALREQHFKLWSEYEILKAEKDIQKERSDSERDIQKERSESERDIQKGRSESERDIQKERSEREKDNLKAEKDFQKVKSGKQKERLLRRISVLTNDIQKVQSTLAAFNPRAMIEYVENWKMTHVKNLPRKDKWVNFLSSSDGQQLLSCIKGSNKLWVDYNVDKVAAKIVEMYSTTSNVHHSTAHGIADGEEIVLQKLAGRIQEFNIAVCIATTYQIVWSEM